MYSAFKKEALSLGSNWQYKLQLKKIFANFIQTLITL